ncbi:uncharacterized protein LOC112553430 isoform X2 [Pomacea canaliculata]|uniref:uncharacterized protein LOC112553430 isoform X2 n=1 Tax=Pomacea canaliculata TaxID=400727 RepID=UPI000D72E1A7|nr:uncharacterized protein LOC112553430 isoform X2 [Pomacea canaliculata]
MYSSTSFNISHDMALTAAGMEQSIDDRTLFCTPAPLAASTIARDAIRMRQMTIPDIKGSFLNEESQLSSQSDSLNLSQELMRPNFSITADANIIPQQAKPQKMDSGSDLIHFSAITEKDGGTITPDEKSDSLTDVSSRSSMGLIPNELLSDLSSSMLPLNTPKGAPSKVGKLNFGSVLSPCREIVGDSTEWSDSSKQDSKDLPMGRSHLIDTVKKKPQFLAEPSVKVAGHGQRALAFITEGLLGNVDEGNELDLSVCDVEFAAEELQKLDEEFSDICEDKDSDDDEISDEEPFLSLPIKSREKNQETDVADSRTKDMDMDSTIQMQGGDPQAETTFHEEENRLGEGQESDKDTKGNQQVAGMSKSGLLDACYFHKTPIPFPGDGEDIEVTSLRSSHTLTNQRGAAEGENLLATLRRQFMSGDGSEIDTEDELEAVREELALSARQRGHSADKAR